MHMLNVVVNLFKVNNKDATEVTPAKIYLFRVNSRNTRKSVKYVQSLQQKHKSDVDDIVLVFLLLTLNIIHTFAILVFLCKLKVYQVQHSPR